MTANQDDHPVQYTPARVVRLLQREKALYALCEQLARIGFSGRLHRHADLFFGTLSVSLEPGHPLRAKVGVLLVSMLPVQHAAALEPVEPGQAREGNPANDSGWEYTVLLRPGHRIGSPEQIDTAAEKIADLMRERISRCQPTDEIVQAPAGRTPPLPVPSSA